MSLLLDASTSPSLIVSPVPSTVSSRTENGEDSNRLSPGVMISLSFSETIPRLNSISLCSVSEAVLLLKSGSSAILCLA